jgi:HK97 family phage major capsid protein
MTQEEMKTQMDEFGKLMKEFRDTATRREEERSKNQGTSDPITRDEVERLNKKLDEVEARYTKSAEEWQNKYTEVFEQMRGFVAAGQKPVGEPEENTITAKNVRKLTPRIVRAMAYGVRNYPDDKWLCEQIFRKEDVGGKEKRVGLLDDTGTGGHYMIPDASSQYIELLSNALVFNGLPVKTIFPTGPVPLNTLATEPTAYCFTTGNPITVSNATFTRSTWNPIRIGALCPIDGAVVRRGDEAVTITQDLMREKAALLTEYEMLLGDGTTGHMTGLDHLGGNVNALNMDASAGYGKFTTNNNVNRLMDLIGAIEADNGIMEGWIFNSRTKWNMRAIQTDNGDYILTVPNNAGDPPTLLSYPYKVTNQIPNTRTVSGKSDCSILFAGKWSDMVIGIWQDVLTSADPSASYVSGGTTYSCRQYDQVLYNLIFEVNCLFRHDKNFGYIDGIRDNAAT